MTPHQYKTSKAIQHHNPLSVRLFNNYTRSPFGLQVNSPQGKAKWAIDQWPMRAKGLIVLVSPSYSDRKSKNKVCKCKLKKNLFGEKNERKTDKFCYSMNITIVP